MIYTVRLMLCVVYMFYTVERQYISYKNKKLILKNLKKILFLNKKNQLLELELKELNDKSNSIAIKKDFQIELQNLRNENLQNQEILKEELEQIEIKNGLLELQLKNVNKNNEINFENLKNIQDKLDYEEINNKCIIYERDKIIENLIFENNNLKNNTSDKVNDIQANYELAQKMEDLYLKLSIAEEQLKQTHILKYNKNKGFFDYLRDIFG